MRVIAAVAVGVALSDTPSYCTHKEWVNTPQCQGKEPEDVDVCDNSFHNYGHQCMVLKPEYGLLTGSTGASFDACKKCCQEDACSAVSPSRCSAKCSEVIDSYGSDCEGLCANNAVKSIDSPIKRMLTKKKAFKTGDFSKEGMEKST
mmetsp:Transcript_4604/g.10856  ORF Transcript_4604/g.10856 Transcript_4604/m.10856 type:complete len:147 (-) Transcript_4604:91-531(-)